MLKDVERLVKEGNVAAKIVSHNYMVEVVEHIPGTCIENQATASKYLALVDLLYDNDAKRIGIWGMGGVGKTTLIKNLNNNLKESSSTLPFDIVLWVTVSQKQDSRKLQMQIAERLHLVVKAEESEESLAKRLHRRLHKKKFILILDDVWETIDLDSLGVPQPDALTGSKIILTSRSFEVCRKMKTDKQLKVEVLNDEDSWLLFIENAGKVVTLKYIEPIARAIAKECGGLPLAIITVGKAMREKTKVELWKDALSELRSSDVPDIEAIETTVFKPLKLSYDSLPGENLKSCFLYCSLYPEDFSIDTKELVKCWQGEGLIEGQKSYEKCYNRGIALIEKLKDSCLLEHGAKEGAVKMHDVVRSVAIWISSSVGDGCKALVRSGINLTQISVSETSTDLKRVSYMHNKISKIPDFGICCPESMSLLLQGNLSLKSIPDGFLQVFKALGVLNLSQTGIKLLPQSIGLLGDLRVLLLTESYLEEISNIGELRNLQVRDCSDTCIKELPSEMKNLMNLRQLYLSETYSLKSIQTGIISSFSSLEVLDMRRSGYIWDIIQQTEENHATFRELLYLEHLLVLSIQLKNIPDFDSRGHTWISRLSKFQFVIGMHQTNFWGTEHDERRVTIIRHDISRQKTNPLLSNATSMFLSCSQLQSTLEMWARESQDQFAGVKALTIARSLGGFIKR